MIIAIDGPAASGKGTLARKLAQHLNFKYLDTGLLYRGVARKMLDDKADLDDEDQARQIAQNIDLDQLNSANLRSADVAQAASKIAVHEGVRHSLIELQRNFAANGNVVLDGRDIGTIICPNAEAKIYVTASPEERALRRAKEFDPDLDPDTALEKLADQIEEIRQRDERDQTRKVAPLRPAEDAYLLDTTKLDIEAVFNAALAYISTRMN